MQQSMFIYSQIYPKRELFSRYNGDQNYDLCVNSVDERNNSHNHRSEWLFDL